MLGKKLWWMVSLAIVAPALAATDDDPDSATPGTGALMLDEVVVVATRTERPLYTTPAAVSTVNAERIEQIQPYGYGDLFEGLPGVSIGGGPRRIAEEPSIRGFSDEQVVIRIDGTRQNFNQAHRGRFLLDPDLLKSVEVVRGASSAAYGSGALGGVFDLVTQDGRDLTAGEDGLGARIKLGYQSNGEEFASFNTLFGQWGGLDALASFVYRDLGEDLEDGNDDDILASKDRIGNGLFKLGYQVSPQQRLELGVERFDNQGRNPPDANGLATATNLVDRDTERRNYRLNYRYDDPSLPWLDLTAVLYRNEIEVGEFRLADGRDDESDFSTNGVELYNTSRLDLGLGALVALTYGAEFYGDRQSGLRNGAPRRQFPDAGVDYSAGFAQAEIPLPAGFTLIPGLRYDRFSYENDGGFPERDDDRLSPKLALGLEATERFYLWADYAKGFRAPSLTELFADGVHFVAPLGPGQVVINEFVPTPDLKAEKSEQVQFGARYRVEGLFGADDTLALEAVYFHNDVDDFVDQTVTFISGPPRFDPATRTLIFPGTTVNSNVDATLRGFEAGAKYDAGGFFAEASLSLLESDRQGSDETLASAEPDRINLRLGARALERQLAFGVELTAADARRDVPEGALATPGYGKTDLFASWLPHGGPLRGFVVQAGIDNVFDKTFRVHPNAIDQPGRTFKVTLSRQFDLLGSR